MGTKSKKSRPFLVWLCFFLGVNLLIALAALGVYYANDIYTNFDDIMAIIRWDVKDTSLFKQDIAERFEHLMRVAMGADYMENYVSTFPNEGDNLIYYAENKITGKAIGNIEKEKVITEGITGGLNGENYRIWDQAVMLPGYDYYIYYNGSGITMQNKYKPVNAYSYGSGYRDTWLSPYLNTSSQYPEIRVLLMVKENITAIPNTFSGLYQIRLQLQQVRSICFAVLGAIALDLALLLIALIKRRTKRAFDRTLARLSGWLWFEVKVVLSALALVFFIQASDDPGPGYSVIGSISFLCCLWWFYIMLVDLGVNRKEFFSHNSVNWAISHYRRYNSKKPFQKALLSRIYALVTVEIILVLFAFGFAVAGMDKAPIAIPFVIAGLYLLYRYLRHFANNVNDLGLIVDRIDAMKNGIYAAASSLPSDSDYYKAWENLDLIQSGIQKAVEEKVRSERMKVELITNVSHDLKTPLTSIISYTDLIAREEGLPETVKDYVQILSQKSERLKTLIQDLFDLSKAASGDMVLEMERIDLVRLLEQTLADMNEQIEQSGLTFRVNTPGSPVYIMSDGRRLYRVFQNLISNALKYSMKASRVYVDLIPGDRAKVEIKNVANYEMDFNADEIMERFVRGDKARSTEGSGLGLAIARSFTQACGGSFNISIDGDLFKVTLAFNRMIDDEEDIKAIVPPQDADLQANEPETPTPQAEGLDEENAEDEDSPLPSLDEENEDSPLPPLDEEEPSSGDTVEDYSADE